MSLKKLTDVSKVWWSKWYWFNLCFKSWMKFEEDLRTENYMASSYIIYQD